MRARLLVLTVSLAATLAPVASAECPRVEHTPNPEALRVANDADTLRAVNLDEAIAKYEEATSLDANDHRLWLKLALAYDKKEAWSKVVVALTRAEAAAERTFGRKTRADFYFHHGSALARLAEKGEAAWADAAPVLATAVAPDPQLADAYAELGRVRAHLGDEEGAMREWTRAIQRRPDTMRYYVALADLYVRWMAFDAAEKVLLEALLFAKDGDKEIYGVHAGL